MVGFSRISRGLNFRPIKAGQCPEEPHSSASGTLSSRRKVLSGITKPSIMKAIFALIALCAVAYAKQPTAPCCCDASEGCDPDGCFDACLDVFPDTVGVCFEAPFTCWCYMEGCLNAIATGHNFLKAMKAH
ncbi:unnamed protein product [Darwinula stevensoni]|uniref:Uncharacterized protein n=1 Tax=Darwinula stevensoni TaxID=69355 RepID=A0A7R9ABR7_9CRUS|nr:unnamed protein product [Darwinula stevensoni]CAG0899465.1 unnamed protein product [Darwinula stevensoni]